MIGGGIFSVLGVAITLAGHLAFGCFVLGARARGAHRPVVGRGHGPLRPVGRAVRAPPRAGSPAARRAAAVAARVRLHGRDGRVLVHVRPVRGQRVRTPAPAAARLLSIAVIVVFLVRQHARRPVSSLTEDLVVLTKLVILVRHRDHRHRALHRGPAVAARRAGASAACSSAPRRSSSPTRASSSSATTATTWTTPTGRCRARCTSRSRSSPPSTSRSRSVRRCSCPTTRSSPTKEVAFVAVGEAALGRRRPLGRDHRARSSRPDPRSTPPCSRRRGSCATRALPASSHRSLGRETDGLPIVAMAFISHRRRRDGDAPRHHRRDRLRLRRRSSPCTRSSTTSKPAPRPTVSCGPSCGSWPVRVALLADLVVQLARHDRPGLVVLFGFVAALTVGRLTFVHRQAARAERSHAAQHLGGRRAPRQPSGDGGDERATSSVAGTATAIASNRAQRVAGNAELVGEEVPQPTAESTRAGPQSQGRSGSQRKSLPSCRARDLASGEAERLSTAKSRRRRRTEVTSEWASAARAMSARIAHQHRARRTDLAVGDDVTGSLRPLTHALPHADTRTGTWPTVDSSWRMGTPGSAWTKYTVAATRIDRVRPVDDARREWTRCRSSPRPARYRWDRTFPPESWKHRRPTTRIVDRLVARARIGGRRSPIARPASRTVCVPSTISSSPRRRGLRESWRRGSPLSRSNVTAVTVRPATARSTIAPGDSHSNGGPPPTPWSPTRESDRSRSRPIRSSPIRSAPASRSADRGRQRT